MDFAKTAKIRLSQVLVKHEMAYYRVIRIRLSYTPISVSHDYIWDRRTLPVACAAGSQEVLHLQTRTKGVSLTSVPSSPQTASKETEKMLYKSTRSGRDCPVSSTCQVTTMNLGGLTLTMIERRSQPTWDLIPLFSVSYFASALVSSRSLTPLTSMSTLKTSNP